MSRFVRVLLVAALVTQIGCGVIQRPGWRKPWGKGTWIPALVCGAVGAGVGVWIQHERPGKTTIRNAQGDTLEIEDDEDLWKGAVIGAPAGAVLCALLGHIFLDPPQPDLPPPPVMAEVAPPAPEPAPPPPAVVRKRIVLRGVNFDYDRSEIKPEFRPVLDEAVLSLGENPDVRLVIEGHTDDRGTNEYNQALSVRRAESVFRYLVNKGLQPERLRLEGFGETRPVASNDDESGRAQNRRVELKVLE
jgi:outer membrane protein OmpA-like peptidoglycan-associated protein